MNVCSSLEVHMQDGAFPGCGGCAKVLAIDVSGQPVIRSEGAGGRQLIKMADLGALTHLCSVHAEPRAHRGMVECVSDDAGRLPLHPLLAARWSPATFAASAPVGVAEIESLLEAARWAPSAGNSQPWAFIVGRRGEPDHARLVRHLAGSSRAWAPTAGLLIANLSHRFVEDTDWQYSEFSVYDLGQAVALMTIQAQALGLSVRQFRAFDRDGLAAEFNVPPHWEVTTMSAIGRVPAGAAPQAATTPNGTGLSRERRPVTDVRWPHAANNHR